MNYIQEIQSRLRTEQRNTLNYFKDGIIDNKSKLIESNKKHVKQNKDVFGLELENSISKYKGVYSKKTEEIANFENPIMPKIAGENYNFSWSGQLLNNLDLRINKTAYEIFSKGLSGRKKDFIFGYGSGLFFGADKKEEDIIFQEVQIYVLEKTFNNIYK